MYACLYVCVYVYMYKIVLASPRARASLNPLPAQYNPAVDCCPDTLLQVLPAFPIPFPTAMQCHAELKMSMG